MAHENRDINPETLGFVRMEKIKCGKPNCHCVNGKKHKAYYLYYRGCNLANPSSKAVLIKKYLSKRIVRETKRKIQLRKNIVSYHSVFGGENDVLMGLIYRRVANLPFSKIIERMHTFIKQVKRSQEYQLLTQEFRLLT